MSSSTLPAVEKILKIKDLYPKYSNCILIIRGFRTLRAKEKNKRINFTQHHGKGWNV